MANLIFFPRNEVHQNIYLKIAKNLNKKHNIFILHEKLDQIINNNIRFISYENEVIKLLKKIKGNSWQNFLENEFLDLQKRNFLFYEREFNYFPSYFGYKRYNYEYQCKYLYSLYKVLFKIIKRYKPKFVISELLNGIPDAVIDVFSKKLNFKYISMRPSKISNGVVFCEPNNDTPINLGMEEFKIGLINIDKIIKGIKSSNYETPEYMELTKKAFNLFKLSRFKIFFDRIKKRNIYYNKGGLYRYPVINPIRYFIKKAKNKFLFKYYTKLFHTYNDIRKDDYVFFPLHYEPESSTMVRSFDWADQLSLIKLLSRQIPPPYVLLIKEHIGNEGFRNNTFYKEISYLPNVKLIFKEVNPYKIISNSKGVICLTGRTGFESFILEKPVAVFGDVFYEKWPHARKIGSFIDFKKWVLSLKKNNIRISDTVKKRYITKYLSYVYDFKFIIGLNATVDKKNIQKIASFFNKLLMD